MVLCKSGNLMCGECKGDLAKGAKSFIVEFKKRRQKAENVVEKFMFDAKEM